MSALAPHPEVPAMPVIELCPVCGREMLPAPDSWGVYVCPLNHGLPPGECVVQTVNFEVAAEWNARPRAYYQQLLREMGICGPVGWVPQASQEGDGRLMYGPAGKKGGSSKSKRKRKKVKTGGKKFVDSPWEEGGTNRK